MRGLDTPLRFRPSAAQLAKSAKFAVLVTILMVRVSAGGWTDRAEYDLVLTIRSEVAPQKRLALLDQWKLKYPATELRQTRRELYLAAYQSLDDSPHMLSVAREMIAEQPQNFTGLYWLTILLPEAHATPELLNEGEKAARALLAGLDQYMSAGKKPSETSSADWQKQKTVVELEALRTLGWIDWQRANYAGAERVFATALEKDPQNTEISAWLGLVSGFQPGKRVPALWHLSRAGSFDGPGALAPGPRHQISALAETMYVSYHGDSTGFENLHPAGETGAFPPAGFSIESAAVIAARRADEELARTNPQLFAWVQIRRRLEAPGSETYFSALQTGLLPKLKGTVIRCGPPLRPKEIVLGLTDPASEEVVLKVSSPFRKGAEPGTQIEFVGTAESFRKEPFTLTITTDQDKIEGWPESGPSR